MDLDLQNPEHIEGLKIQTFLCVYFFTQFRHQFT